jgi:hypothetical protein
MAARFLSRTDEDQMSRKSKDVLEASEVMIAIPLGLPPDHGYEANQAKAGKVSLTQRAVHIHANLGETAAHAFLRIRNGLRERTAKLASGRPVWSNTDALRWLMEQVATESA